MIAQLELDFTSPASDDGYRTWLEQRAKRKGKLRKNSPQVQQVDVPEGDDESGYANWQSEQTSFRQQLERKWGIILGQPVELQLTFLDSPLRGIIRISQADSYDPTFEIRDLTFTTSDVQSVVKTQSEKVS